MKVLHINKSDLMGGAAIAMFRLHQGLLAQNIDSKLLVDIARTHSNQVATIPRQRLDKSLKQITLRFGLNNFHITSTFDLLNHPFVQAADILHLHNLHDKYFNYLALPALTRHKPAVLTLHDMWAMTGHCAYSFDCDRWRTGCGHCPYPKTYPAIKADRTHWEWKFKQWAYNHANLKAVVTTNQWLLDLLPHSLLRGLPSHRIPYCLDTQLYRPLDTQQCRSLLGIPEDKQVLLFGAQNLTDTRKGGDLLLAALAQLPDTLKPHLQLLTFGQAANNIAQLTDIDTLELGFISSDQIKAIIYSAADLFLFPTRFDTFGLVAQEAMACGTPVVSFQVGGVPDVVRPGVTGYLAEPENVADFRQGMVQLLEDQTTRDRLSQSCRAVAVQEYGLEVQAQQYLELYHQVLKN